MTFDKFIEKATIIDTIILTIVLCIGQKGMTIFRIVITLPMMGLALLAMYEHYCDNYKNLKETIKKDKVQLQKQGSYSYFKSELKKYHAGYIASISMSIFWNISIFVIILLWIDKYWYNIF